MMETMGQIEWHKVKAILFDIDGTLSDSDDQAVARVKRILSPFNFFINEKRRHAFARWLVMAIESPGNFVYNLADRMELDSLFIKILNQRSRNKKHKLKKYWIIPGVEAMLEKLEKRLLMGIVSARDEASSLAFIHQFGLRHYFKVVVTSQTCHHTKPFPDPLLFAARELNIEPENCLMVGDTTVDMRAAQLAGMQAVGVLCGFGTQRELLRAGANLILESPAELADLIERYLEGLM